MAYPTGAGTEVLFRGAINSQANDPTALRWDRTNPTLGTETYAVPALHIITLLSVIFCDQANASGTFQMYARLADDTDIWILEDIAMAQDETFVFNDKIVLVGGDKMIVDAGSGDAYDIWYTYIDQDWT